MNIHPILPALLGTGFITLMTALGSSVVFFFRGTVKDSLQRVFLGFAAGVMIAASVWSLLIPSIERSEELGHIGWIPAAGGLVLGALFLLLMDKLLPHLHPDSAEPEGMHSGLRRTTMLVFAVTLHNIPEGMAVGLAFALGSQTANPGLESFAGAAALAVGIGIQNFPEGAAISLPLRKEGFSRKKAFAFGCLSGVVELIAGMLTFFAAAGVTPIMPWLLAFAAGAMIYVTIEELIPEAHLGEHSDIGTMSVIFGFLVMMILDVALG